jgi:hypothetical protein
MGIGITGEELVREEERAMWEDVERARATPLGKEIERMRARHEMLILTTPYSSSTVHSPNCTYCKTKQVRRPHV